MKNGNVVLAIQWQAGQRSLLRRFRSGTRAFADSFGHSAPTTG